MSGIIIKAEDLGKKYVIGHQSETTRYVALRDVLASNARSIWHKTRDLLQGRPIIPGTNLEEVWAVRDMSFEIRRGEVVGIIGSNGAGKSTLLKILSRITEPTEGRVRIRGRVASLLEVGTGFHPELTGRENIFLNGAVLGMTRQEIKRKFDEIVAFAEVEKFLDTPVKRYSSGMYVRLAFSVAAHLEAEILLVDEVLAVGDAAFQSRCLGKMGGFAREGRTVLLVSHQMSAIESLCTRCLLVSGGRLLLSGSSRDVTKQYLGMATGERIRSCRLDGNVRKKSYASARMVEVFLSSGDGVPVSEIQMGSSLAIHVVFRVREPIQPVLGVVVKTGFGFRLFGINNRIVAGQTLNEVSTEAVITCQFDRMPLMPGTYYLDLYLGDPFGDIDVVTDAISFEVFPSDVFGTGRLPPQLAGPLFLSAHWTLKDTALSPSFAIGTSNV